MPRSLFPAASLPQISPLGPYMWLWCLWVGLVPGRQEIASGEGSSWTASRGSKCQVVLGFPLHLNGHSQTGACAVRRAAAFTHPLPVLACSMAGRPLLQGSMTDCRALRQERSGQEDQGQDQSQARDQGRARPGAGPGQASPYPEYGKSTKATSHRGHLTQGCLMKLSKLWSPGMPRVHVFMHMCACL